ncbi:MAG: hypothetical protein LBL83_02645, partial [Clostridiales bacterium]|nr:hypothetical protein [Clostridiales bacterium]
MNTPDDSGASARAGANPSISASGRAGASDSPGNGSNSRAGASTGASAGIGARDNPSPSASASAGACDSPNAVASGASATSASANPSISASDSLGASAVGARRATLYAPKSRPGFVAWATAFDYGDGGIGLSFKETLRRDNPDFAAPTLEAVEAMAVPYSYGSVIFGGRDFCSYWVYMRSDDGGRSFRETGRAPLGQGSDINVGFPGGRVVGYHTPPNADPCLPRGCIYAMESLDGGASWRRAATLLPGNSIYLWRARRLRDGTVILMASLYGTAWGPGRERATRNTMLPGETPVSKVQTFFMASADGIAFSGPHYILPGTGAHEFDMVELGDGEMLFFQGDVQGTPPARQKVRRDADGRFVNGPVHAVRRGAPAGGGYGGYGDAQSNDGDNGGGFDPQGNCGGNGAQSNDGGNDSDGGGFDPQGGFLPETIVRLPNGLLVGARRHKAYSCSPDEGENWYEIDGLPPSLYQPFLMLAPGGGATPDARSATSAGPASSEMLAPSAGPTPDGQQAPCWEPPAGAELICFGHFGGDVAFGQKDMFIGADYFRVDSRL